jgi:hypothetical protein
LTSIDDIKAKDFFKALKSGEGISKENLIRLKDEYFLARNDGIERNNLNISKKITLLTHKLAVLELAKTIYQDLPLDGERRAKVSKSLKNIGFTLKITEKTTSKDIDNQFRSFMGAIRNAIEINKLNLVEIKGTNDFNFAEVIVSFEMILEKSIDENLSLAKFIAYEKMANKIIEKRSKK